MFGDPIAGVFGFFIQMGIFFPAVYAWFCLYRLQRAKVARDFYDGRAVEAPLRYGDLPLLLSGKVNTTVSDDTAKDDNAKTEKRGWFRRMWDPTAAFIPYTAPGVLIATAGFATGLVVQEGGLLGGTPTTGTRFPGAVVPIVGLMVLSSWVWFHHRIDLSIERRKFSLPRLHPPPHPVPEATTDPSSEPTDPIEDVSMP